MNNLHQELSGPVDGASENRLPRPVRLRDYLVNRTDEYSSGDSGKGTPYWRMYGRHVDLALGAWLTTGFLSHTPASKSLLIASGVIVTDMAVRAIRGDHGRKAVSGLIGVVRELYDRL